jgi:hypothetical protein
LQSGERVFRPGEQRGSRHVQIPIEAAVDSISCSMFVKSFKASSGDRTASCMEANAVMEASAVAARSANAGFTNAFPSQAAA